MIAILKESIAKNKTVINYSDYNIDFKYRGDISHDDFSNLEITLYNDENESIEILPSLYLMSKLDKDDKVFKKYITEYKNKKDIQFLVNDLLNIFNDFSKDNEWKNDFKGNIDKYIKDIVSWLKRNRIVLITIYN